MLLSAVPITEADSLLLMLWESILPWGFHIIVAIIVIAFRGVFAEWWAEAVFIYRRRLARLEQGAGEQKFIRKFYRTLWGDICVWETMLARAQAMNGSEASRADLGDAVAQVAEDLRFARQFVRDPALRDKFTAWEKKCVDAENTCRTSGDGWSQSGTALATLFASEISNIIGE